MTIEYVDIDTTLKNATKLTVEDNKDTRFTAPFLKKGRAKAVQYWEGIKEHSVYKSISAPLGWV